MLRKDTSKKDQCQVRRIIRSIGVDEKRHLGRAVHHYQDCVEAVGRQELLNEIH